MEKTTPKKRQLTGTVVSAKMLKTVVVRVDRLKLHPKYKQRYRVSKKFKAHNEDASVVAGDTVVIEETRPLSREKRWKVVETVKRSQRAPITEPTEAASEEPTESAA